jgi:hypothetical protein
MAELVKSHGNSYVRIVFSTQENEAKGVENYLTLDDVAGTNLGKRLAPKECEIIDLKVPLNINPDLFRLYIASYNPKRCQVRRDPSCLIDLVYVVRLIGDLQPLHRLGEYLNRAGDEYFWLHLAENAQLFHAQLNDTLYQEEMARIEDEEENQDEKEEKDGKEVAKRGIGRRVDLTPQKRDVGQALSEVDTLRDLSQVDLSYRAIDIRYTLAPTKVKIIPDNRREWADRYTRLNVPLLKALNKGEDTKEALLESFADAGKGYMKYLSDRLDLVEKILAIPGVAICGGLPAYLINPFFSKKAHYECVLDPMDSKCNMTKAFLFKDLDIFLYGDHDIKETVDRIMALIPDCAVTIYKHSITMLDRSHGSFCVQIIKRHYRTLTQILSGFDLDSSACAMIMESSEQKVLVVDKQKKGGDDLNERKVLLLDEGKEKPLSEGKEKPLSEGKEKPLSEGKRIRFYGTDRFIEAVRHGINVVNPHRQSTTFNYRLRKYSERGYFPYIAGQVHLRFPQLYMERIVRCDRGRHTLPELLRGIKNFPKREGERTISDYTGDTLAVIFQECESGLPIRGSNVELLKGVFDEFEESDEYKKYCELKKSDDNEENMNEAMNKFLHARGYPVKVHAFRRDIQNPSVRKYLHMGWLTRRPGTQANGSFQPTTHDYFGEELPESEELLEEFF